MKQNIDNYVISQDDYNKIRLLLRKDIDMNEVQISGDSILYQALISENEKVLKILFKYQQYQESFLSEKIIHYKSSFSYLHVAFAAASNYNFVDFVLSQLNDINFNYQDNSGDTALHLLAPKLEMNSFYKDQHFNDDSVHDKVYHLTLNLLEKGANLEVMNKPGYTFIDLIDDMTCKQAITQAKEAFAIIKERERLNTLTEVSVKNSSKNKL